LRSRKAFLAKSVALGCPWRIGLSTLLLDPLQPSYLWTHLSRSEPPPGVRGKAAEQEERRYGLCPGLTSIWCCVRCPVIGQSRPKPVRSSALRLGWPNEASRSLRGSKAVTPLLSPGRLLGSPPYLSICYTIFSMITTRYHSQDWQTATHQSLNATGAW
jgi:hypothetical protein